MVFILQFCLRFLFQEIVFVIVVVFCLWFWVKYTTRARLLYGFHKNCIRDSSCSNTQAHTHAQILIPSVFVDLRHKGTKHTYIYPNGAAAVRCFFSFILTKERTKIQQQQHRRNKLSQQWNTQTTTSYTTIFMFTLYVRIQQSTIFCVHIRSTHYTANTETYQHQQCNNNNYNSYMEMNASRLKIFKKKIKNLLAIILFYFTLAFFFVSDAFNTIPLMLSCWKWVRPIQ